MKRTWIALFLLAVLVGGFLVWWSRAHQDDAILAGRNKIILQLQWYPQAQFMGFYVAKAKNYYAAEGLSVDFAHGGPEVDPIKNLVSGQAQIGLATGDQVLIWSDRNKDPHLSLKAVGTVFNQSIAAFMSKPRVTLDSPQDFIGKTIGVYPTYDTENLLLALLEKHKIPQSKVKLVSFPSFLSFEDDTVQVFPSYLINEPLLAEQRGIHSPNLLRPSDHGVRFYSDTIFTTGEYYSKNQEMIRKFLRASAKGWAYAQQNPQESLDLMYQVVKGAIGTGQPQEHQAAMLREALKYIDLGPNTLTFHMDKTRWEDMEKDLFAIHRLSKMGSVDAICDFKIVEEALK